MQLTFPHLMQYQAARRPGEIAMREKKYGIWQTTTWSELSRLVEAMACGLSQAGLQRKDHLVLVGNNRPRLYAAMLAAQSLGAVPVPLYQDAVAAELVFPINNANVRYCIVEDQEQVDKLLEVRDDFDQEIRIWYDEPRGLRNYVEECLFSLDELIQQGQAFAREYPEFFQQQVDAGHPEDVAAMFFTSGTTADPKGVVHTHESLIDRARAGAEFDRLQVNEEVLAYLPPAWIGQNIFSYAQWLVVGYVVNCPESNSTVSIDLKEVGPTYYFAPPRVFEGLLTHVMIRMEDAGKLMQMVFRSCMALARRVGPDLLDKKSVGPLDRFLYRIGNIFVYGPLRNNLGFSRVRVAYTAGEAIGPDLFTFYRSIGVNLKQLYGSTETAVFVCLQPDNDARADSVGIPCAGVEIKISESGEVLVKTPGLLKEYHNNPEETAGVISEDGWYRTSDAGFIDATGHLKIIDRVKDVGRINGGAFTNSMFAPKYIENKLKFFSFIKEAVAFGDGRDKVCVMINIDFDAVGNWAERRNLPYAGYTDLASKHEVYELILECVEKVNEELSGDELLAGSQISRFLILHKELDADDGELTRTNKVRRRFIGEKYAVLVDALYGSKGQQYIETQVKYEDGRVGSISATLKILDSKVFFPPTCEGEVVTA